MEQRAAFCLSGGVSCSAWSPLKRVGTIPYLAGMPFAGAIGAYLSRRMKGAVVERIMSALFPVFAFVALFAVRIVYGLFFEGEAYTLPHFRDGLSLLLMFIAAGGLLLVLGDR